MVKEIIQKDPVVPQTIAPEDLELIGINGCGDNGREGGSAPSDSTNSEGPDDGDMLD